MITSDRAGLVQVMLIMAWLVLDRELRIDPIEQVLKLQCPCSHNGWLAVKVREPRLPALAKARRDKSSQLQKDCGAG